MKFVIATRPFAGLGFAMRLQEEGHEVLMAYTGTRDRRVQPRYDLVGNGIVPKRPLADVIGDRESFLDWYFGWDENHSPDENELLRGEGFKVVLGGTYANLEFQSDLRSLRSDIPFILQERKNGIETNVEAWACTWSTPRPERRCCFRRRQRTTSIFTTCTAMTLAIFSRRVTMTTC